MNEDHESYASVPQSFPRQRLTNDDTKGKPLGINKSHTDLE